MSDLLLYGNGYITDAQYDMVMGAWRRKKYLEVCLAGGFIDRKNRNAVRAEIRQLRKTIERLNARAVEWRKKNKARAQIMLKRDCEIWAPK